MTLVSSPVETLSYVNGAGIAVNTNAETAVLTTDVVQPYANPASQQPQPGNPAPQVIRPVTIRVNVGLVAGTAATAVQIRCRQGNGLGGAQVGFPANGVGYNVIAGQQTQTHIVFRDSSGAAFAPGGIQYTVSAQQTGATGNGNIAMDVEVTQ